MWSKGRLPSKPLALSCWKKRDTRRNSFDLLGDFSPDTGRLGNRMWCFFAGNALPTRNPAYKPEAGIDFVLYRGTLAELLRERGFYSALNCAALLAAVLQGKLKI